MPGRRCAIVVASAALLAFACPISVMGAAITWVPTGLNAGDTYHLVYVTSTTRNATSTDIGDYNTFVDDAMGAIDDASPYGDIVWKCIGSTATVDARDNMGYAASSSPVYRLDDTKVADGSADLWDGTIDAVIDVDENGTSVALGRVWTGTDDDGVAFGSRQLGTAEPVLGNTVSTVFAWTRWAYEPNTDVYWQYGFSEELTVPAVPEPGTVVLSLMGLAAGAVLRRRRRRSPK